MYGEEGTDKRAGRAEGRRFDVMGCDVTVTTDGTTNLWRVGGIIKIVGCGRVGVGGRQWRDAHELVGLGGIGEILL